MTSAPPFRPHASGRGKPRMQAVYGTGAGRRWRRVSCFHDSIRARLFHARLSICIPSPPCSPPRPRRRAGERGDVALNMGRGLGSGMSVGWTFKENWTLQPTIALGYSDVAGFQASLGGTVLRSFGWGHRVYGDAGAGIYYGVREQRVCHDGRRNRAAAGDRETAAGATTPYYPTSSITYLTAPAGLRARLHGNFELVRGSRLPAHPLRRVRAGPEGPVLRRCQPALRRHARHHHAAPVGAGFA